ncbi:hypothetical protein JCGZ_24079 [Jatropha curcas]|uniref:SOSEKI DIX-like domain-containing protein n=1 Tax=Jatropha curcas TaxID=180498 RepID=A0A067LPP7_JATCU|nr:protein UPSTREAM OF FLC isoform X2 [Jatropha curcas]KDP46870.1 hypothetical protein JCGZ_24079 [Jatropha curcas]
MDNVRHRRTSERENSPNRAKVSIQVQPKQVKSIRKIQVIYYLSRNGHLQHPHFMEVTHFANQHLRLKDFMDRLTVLRGKGMPSLYSWSCKRSYKNGYVWNDLAENDIIYPSDGAEYVLKGSELVEGCSEKFQELQLSNNNIQLIQEPKYHAKPKQLGPSQLCTKYEFEEYEEEDQEQESQEEYEDEEKTSYTTSTTPHSRCSRGVSTEELEDQQEATKNPNSTEPTHPNSCPPPSTSSSIVNKNKHQNTTSKRFEDGDPIATESPPSRNSVLLQLISCGNLAVAKAKGNSNGLSLKQPEKMKKNDIVIKRSSESNLLHKGVLCKSAMRVGEEEMMISCMSENPRFGNLQVEEKQYFSGSIVESVSENRVAVESALKRSNSYNEERSKRNGVMEEAVREEDIKEVKATKAKCIPLKKASSTFSCSSSSKQTKKY